MATTDFKTPTLDFKGTVPTAPGSPSSPSPTSAIWQAALQKYYDELAKGGIKAAFINKDLWSIRGPEDLLAHINALKPLAGSMQQQQGPWTTKTYAQLQGVLLSLNDFATLVAWVLGMNGKVAAVLWGSIRLIIKFAQPVLPDLVQMLETLQAALPRMKQYEENLPMTDALEKALVDLYSEVIVFCAHAITFFRNTPNVKQNRHAWSQFSRDFARIVDNVERLSRRVDETADMIRLSREVHTAETVSALETMHLGVGIGVDGDKDAHGHTRPAPLVLGVDGKPIKLPCFALPYGINLRFFERDKELALLAEALDPPSLSPGESPHKLRAIGIHGLGGVGKSQLALQYANTSMDKYTVIAWLPAASEIALTQGLSRLAIQLGLVADATASQDSVQSVQAVRDYFNTSRETFLLIFDNVDDAGVLDAVWPSSGRGSVVITTRSPGVAAQRTATTLALRCFSDDGARRVLQTLVGASGGGGDEEGGEDEGVDGEGDDADTENAALDSICRLVGGLPLAMVQIGDFMRNRACSYAEFLRLYETSAERVLTKSAKPVEYEHTVLTTWDLSLHRLSDDGRRLQNLLAFLDPDRVLESVLTNAKAVKQLDVPDFLFLADSFDFGDAVMELSRTSMVSRMARSKALSMHRMAQLAVLLRIAPDERAAYFDTVVRLLYHGFPNTWKAGGHHQGHGWAAWATCSAVLPHVSWLMQLAQTHKIISTVPTLYAELIFRAGTYLWEKEQPYLAESFFRAGLQLTGDAANEDTAQAHRLLGHIYLDVARPRAALEAYQRALAMRATLSSQALPADETSADTPAIAAVCDSIACALTEIGDVDAAFAYLARAIAIHDTHDPGNTGSTGRARTLAIRAMTCLRAGGADDALAALHGCWTLQGMDQQQIQASRYPKHSGDIMLLARILWAQTDKGEGKEGKEGNEGKEGTNGEARELVARTLVMRRGVFGETHTGPRVADSLFTLARMLQDEGQPVLAAQLLREIVAMAGGSTATTATDTLSRSPTSSTSSDAGEQPPTRSARPPLAMRSHLARAYWFLANVDASLSADAAKVAWLRSRAREARDWIVEREGSDSEDDDTYMHLVGYMLW